MHEIHVPEDKSYTLSEVIDAIQLTLDAVRSQSAHNELRYSSKDVYWLLHDMILYVNQNIPGEFILYQTSKGFYRIRYNAENTARRSSSRKLEAEMKRTADYLEELTGRRPPWSEKE